MEVETRSWTFTIPRLSQRTETKMRKQYSFLCMEDIGRLKGRLMFSFILAELDRYVVMCICCTHTAFIILCVLCVCACAHL